MVEKKKVAIQMELIGRSRQSPLIGRTHELETLRAMLLETEQSAQAQLIRQRKEPGIPLDTQRRPQCVVLFGDPGIGKTRLAEEVSREAQTRGWTAIWSRMYVQESGIPYRLWTDVLRKALDIDSELVLALLASAQETLSIQPLTALLPELNEMFPQAVDTSVTLPFMPGQEQLRLWEAARALLMAVSERMPLLIVLDDLQWIDASSCELLGYLARHLYGYPIVLLGTCRESDLPVRPPHPLHTLIGHMQRERAVMTLRVEPLTTEQIGQLIASIAAVPGSIVEHIQERAAGNPFFAEELVRSSSQTLPKTLIAALGHRVSRLSAPCQQLLGHAAVLGSSFELALIYAMEAGSTSMDEDAVLDLLEEALQAEVLTEEETGTRISYHFWHPLLVEHLYAGISATRRARLHERVAEMLLRLHQEREEEVAATITHHLVMGGAEARQIAHYAELAATRAYAFSSYPDAEKFYRIVLAHLGIDEGSVSVNNDEQLHLAYILECLGECTRIQGKYEEARTFYERTLDVYTQRTLLKSSQEYRQEIQMQALLWCEIGLTWYNAGKNVEARQCYQYAEQVLLNAGIATGPAWANLRREQSLLYWREGDYEEARITAFKAQKLSEGVVSQQESGGHTAHLTRIRRTLAGDPVNLGRAHSLLGLIAASAGWYGERETFTHLKTALTLFEQYGSQREIAIVCCNLGDFHMRKTEHDLAQAFFRRSLSIAERIGEIPLVSFIFGDLGILDTRCGNLERAEDEFRKGIALAEQSDDPVYLNIWYAQLATMLQKQGRLADASSALRRSLALSRAMHIAPYMGLSLMTLGSLRIAQAIAANVDESNNGDERLRNLKRAQKTLRHVLALEGLEVETRTEARLLLAQAMLLLGDEATASSLATQTLEESSQFELTWLMACTQRLLGDICAAQGKYEQAEQNFELAMQAFRASGMRLDYARTLYCYSEALMTRGVVEEKVRQRAPGYLQEARQIFTECKAMLDVQLVERALAQCRSQRG